jgi:hypothetical protein
MTDIPTDLVINLELLLAYSPGAGRLWRVDGAGRLGRELQTWSCTIRIVGKHKAPTHAIHYIMVGRWLLDGHVIGYIDGNKRNTRWSNLKECMYGQCSSLAPIPAPADLVTNLDLLLAYSPALGKLWRTDREGTPGRERVIWRWDKARCLAYATTILVPGFGIKVATHAIWFMMTGAWPAPGHVIDHRDRMPMNNAFGNLREATYTQNRANSDIGTRTRGADELLEIGVVKRPSGYAVILAGDYYGTYRNPIEANQIARERRRELYGEFALAPVTSRRMIRGRPAP